MSDREVKNKIINHEIARLSSIDLLKYLQKVKNYRRQMTVINPHDVSNKSVQKHPNIISCQFMLSSVTRRLSFHEV